MITRNETPQPVRLRAVPESIEAMARQVLTSIGERDPYALHRAIDLCEAILAHSEGWTGAPDVGPLGRLGRGES